MSPEDKRHGTMRGYRLHREHDEPHCGPCGDAWYRYNKRATYLRETGKPLRVSALGTNRRVRALMALGYGLPTLAGELGIATGNLSYKLQQPYVVRRTHDAVAEMFERLAMQPPPQGWVAQRTRNIARKKGWAPPLAWDDIDDPDEQPRGLVRDRDDIDEAVVLRILAGDNRVKATPAERAEVCRRWVADGRGVNELARLTGWKVERYYTSRERLTGEAVA